MTEERAVLAGGCFWGMQDLIRKRPGVIRTRVGYSGGDVPNATYRNHGTHADAIEVLIDPAGHGGHRETDLAMLHLFGCPHLDRVVAAYEEASPLADDWRGRIGLHQLFPLLVHAVLFGRGFAEQAVAAARSALRG